MESLSYAEAARRVKAAGYDGMEIAVWDNKYDEAVQAVRDNGLDLILMAFSIGDSFAEMKKNYRGWLDKVTSYQPRLINSHTGKDWYSFEQNSELIQLAMEVQQQTGVAILHETHRGRFTYSAPAVQPYITAFPQLRLTADLSHWVNVSESLLTDQPDNVQRAIQRTDHIHSRVGHPQGPQVNDPRAPEWKEALEIHLAWWDAMVETHREKGTTTLTITCEFGPAPGYLPTLPYTNLPVASQWDINLYMKDLLSRRYNRS
jgi:sugar phosphate isomerase/epimerase